MFRTISIILAALFVVGFLVACGGTDDPADKTYIQPRGGASDVPKATLPHRNRTLET